MWLLLFLFFSFRRSGIAFFHPFSITICECIVMYFMSVESYTLFVLLYEKSDLASVLASFYVLYSGKIGE